MSVSAHARCRSASAEHEPRARARALSFAHVAAIADCAAVVETTAATRVERGRRRSRSLLRSLRIVSGDNAAARVCASPARARASAIALVVVVVAERQHRSSRRRRRDHVNTRLITRQELTARRRPFAGEKRLQQRATIVCQRRVYLQIKKKKGGDNRLLAEILLVAAGA